MKSTANQSFRDQITTADRQGRRIWIYPTKPKGKLYTARTLVSWILLLFLFSAPLIKFNDQPLLLFNFLERKFIIFGLTFWPQDFHLFVLAAITLVVFIILFTAVFGRLFCGWICPQTIFMEMVFRKIEYFIEGSTGSQKRLDNAPLTVSKFIKKSLKHFIFYGISFIIGNTFLAYIISFDKLHKIITDPPMEHWLGLLFMILFSLVFYWIFARFREQVCILVCPYGRLQSVLLDKNSIVIAYDFQRGEPRAFVSRKDDFNHRGHCIDCFACVKVCPTGIDIRNGTQLECINCTACIDTCNNVMRKLKLPSGLIRYASASSIKNKTKFKITSRIAGYSIVLSFLILLMTFLLINRSDIETTILRTPGTLYEQTSDSKIRNLYNLKIVNKTFDEIPIILKLKSPEGVITVIGPEIIVPKDNLIEAVFFVDIKRELLYRSDNLIVIEIYSNEKLVDEIKSSFMGPELRKN